MKKFTTIFFIIITIFITIISFNKNNSKELERLLNIEQTGNAVKIVMPESIKSIDKKKVFGIIDNTLKKYDGNLILSKVDTNNNIYQKYIYCTNNDYLNKIKIDSGRNLSIKDNWNHNFISMKNTSKSNQIGVISNFGGNYNLEIHTLKSFIDSGGNFDGVYVINYNKSVNSNVIVKTLEDKLNVNITTMPIYPDSLDDIPLYPIIIVLYLITAILIFYDILNSYKEIAIEKLNGYSNKRIWLSRICVILITQFFIFLLVSFITSIIIFKQYNIYYLKFILSLLFLNIIFLLVSFIMFSIPFIYVKHIKIVDMLKNKNEINTIIKMNSVIKIVLTVILLTMSITSISDYKQIKGFYNDSFKVWEKTKNYVVIPYLYALPPNLINTKLTKFSVDLYKYFNKTGAILADFEVVSNEYLTQNPSKNNNIETTIKVNPNYLSQNFIYDMNNKKINISEKNKNFVLLVPQKYKAQKQKIINFYTFQNGQVEIENQKTSIIWIKNDQKIFSYRLDINPKEGNTVKNSIIQVLTENNGTDSDYDIVLGVNGNPFKIKTNNPNGISNYIRPKLKELGINQYLPEITSVYDSISYDIEHIKLIMEISIVSTLISLFGIVIITIQNIFNYFEQNKRILAIESFHGYKMRDKYLNYLKNISIIWAIIIIASLVISVFKIVSLLTIVIPILIIEFLISIVTIKLIEKKNLIRIVKGG